MCLNQRFRQEGVLGGVVAIDERCERRRCHPAVKQVIPYFSRAGLALAATRHGQDCAGLGTVESDTKVQPLTPDFGQVYRVIKVSQDNNKVGHAVILARMGLDGVEALRQFANAPHTPDEGPESWGVRSLAHLLMMSRNWREMRQKAADIRLPEFHR